MTHAKADEPDMTQDLRLAIEMSGGVSLAVWMGGVAREVNLLQQASNRRSEKSEVDPHDRDACARKLYRNCCGCLT